MRMHFTKVKNRNLRDENNERKKEQKINGKNDANRKTLTQFDIAEEHKCSVEFRHDIDKYFVRS